MTLRVAVDIGGTFTDLVLHDPEHGDFRAAKVPSTPPAFAEGVRHALQTAEAQGAEVFVHGSTVVINTLTERRGAKVALVTTRGFRDVLEIQRTNRPDLYNVRYRKPEPFVPREHRYEVTERMGPDGRVLVPLDEAELRKLARRLRAEGFAAVAVAFLNSYRNPAHERRAGEILAEELPGTFVALSSTVREWREYERSNTAVLSAYVGPVVDRYLAALEADLDEAGVGPARSLMLSSGGRTTFAQARRWPIDLVESGPAAGVMGAVAEARALGLRDFVTLDVGGTTAKACLVENGQPLELREYPFEKTARSAGYPLILTSLDLMEIGAGGGSLIRRRPDGSIGVGPESAGADPGPAAYGRGGREPTVTDACLLTGRLPTRLAGGRTLSPELAEAAFAPLARATGLDVRTAAEGSLRLAEATMARVLELSTIARGRDPRGLALVAFGGQGPLHAVKLAQELGFREVVIPPEPGVFSARAMLKAPWRVDLAETLWVPWPEGRDEVAEAARRLAAEVRAWLRREGVAGRALLRTRVACRYVGQTHAIEVGLRSDIAGAFHRAHRRLYAFRLDAPIEVTAVRVTGFVPGDPIPEAPPAGGDGRPVGERVLREEGREAPLPVFRRADLPVGRALAGPLVVEEATATTFVPPGAALTVGATGHLFIRPGGA
jgi:N-methylhydantoinase A